MSHDDLRALFLNCTLKKSPERSHTHGLIDLSSRIMEKQGVQVGHLRPIDHEIATGVWPDMTEHGWQRGRRHALRHERPVQPTTSPTGTPRS